jgi:hypothetical protein
MAMILFTRPFSLTKLVLQYCFLSLLCFRRSNPLILCGAWWDPTQLRLWRLIPRRPTQQGAFKNCFDFSGKYCNTMPT